MHTTWRMKSRPSQAHHDVHLVLLRPAKLRVHLHLLLLLHLLLHPHPLQLQQQRHPARDPR